MDEEAAYTLRDEFIPTDALARYRAMVDADLAEVFVQNMSAAALLASYRMFGRDPVMLGDDALPFSAWDYAKTRAVKV